MHGCSRRGARFERRRRRFKFRRGVQAGQVQAGRPVVRGGPRGHRARALRGSDASKGALRGVRRAVVNHTQRRDVIHNLTARRHLERVADGRAGEAVDEIERVRRGRLRRRSARDAAQL